MGSNGSKPDSEPVVNDLIPKNDVDIQSDPRSPTPEIIRTPLQGKPGAKHNITKNCDLRKTFDTAATDEKLIRNNPILSAVIKNHLQSYDPRSPSQDFERTPIVIASKIEEIKNGKKLNRQINGKQQSGGDSCDNCTEANELNSEIIIPKNLCNKFCDMSLNGTINNIEEPLGSSTASNEVIEEVMSPELVFDRPTKLLETDFDYVEYVDEKFEESCENVQNASDTGPNGDLKNALVKVLENDPRSPSIGIERTPIVVTKIDEDTEDNVEEMSDDSLIKVLQNTNADLRHTIKATKAEDGLLVYEDETTNINDTPKKSKLINNGSRTPLSCMKNKDGVHTRSKSANMLYDPKNQKTVASKIPKRVSHIPRLKSLSQTTKLAPVGSSVSLKNISKASSISGDCENTPPHSHRDRWDKDCSIIL